MAVSAVMNSTTQSGSVAKTTSGESTSSSGAAGMGSSVDELMNNFMTLLVAQMQNQDPTNPMDNNQLTTQLAQFNTAAGVQQLNGTLNGVGMLVTSMQQMNAADWVGRHVLIEGDSVVSTAEDGNKEFAFSVNSGVDKVTVTLTDSAGNAYTAELNEVKAGVNKYSLSDLSNFQPADPRDMEGASFTVTYAAVNDDGSKPEITALKKAKVEGVSFTLTGAELQLGVNGTAALGDVYMIE